ncbi:sigma-70 family RNA polymerase sigma factor [uncultured Porticoccus sp.]|uniref:sigma-70 family RNA polymerase sigma factor n=1 Tax=uncultured Porticoccus sp. TaxID=1256050 RepID=UPI002637C544|nr:sigma-70 family RNA polymerase sigma factor [uncultured Porticoccus sp.]
MQDQPPGDEALSVVALRAEKASEAPVKDWSAMLAELAISRDRQLFIRLFRHFSPRIKGYIMKLGLTEATAEELTQEAMLSVWRKTHLYDPGKAAASTWIYTLARNLSIDWMRKQKYPEYDLDSWHEEAGEPPVLELAEQAVMSDQVAMAIRQLPDNQAQVIIMSFYEGRSHSEIADRLSIPLGSVKSRIRLASEKLKQALRGNHDH